ncbi:hypothetical protein CNMCM6805_002012 [Aspergillus fumigatiaffinis]|uniref:Uncharacterized protein n=1 Tax=Aspergillus fumigatiaffinis TaxID=340414 RepID=A0A8H4HG67_9EURO|nr:hypothetical protein CNMCM6805_002012 [Aspergillus fumigatiaffinis]
MEIQAFILSLLLLAITIANAEQDFASICPSLHKQQKTIDADIILTYHCDSYAYEYDAQSIEKRIPPMNALDIACRPMDVLAAFGFQAEDLLDFL